MALTTAASNSRQSTRSGGGGSGLMSGSGGGEEDAAVDTFIANILSQTSRLKRTTSRGGGGGVNGAVGGGIATWTPPHSPRKISSSSSNGSPLANTAASSLRLPLSPLRFRRSSLGATAVPSSSASSNHRPSSSSCASSSSSSSSLSAAAAASTRSNLVDGSHTSSISRLSVSTNDTSAGCGGGVVGGHSRGAPGSAGRRKSLPTVVEAGTGPELLLRPGRVAADACSTPRQPSSSVIRAGGDGGGVAAAVGGGGGGGGGRICEGVGGENGVSTTASLKEISSRDQCTLLQSTNRRDCNEDGEENEGVRRNTGGEVFMVALPAIVEAVVARDQGQGEMDQVDVGKEGDVAGWKLACARGLVAGTSMVKEGQEAEEVFQRGQRIRVGVDEATASPVVRRNSVGVSAEKGAQDSLARRRRRTSGGGGEELSLVLAGERKMPLSPSPSPSPSPSELSCAGSAADAVMTMMMTPRFENGSAQVEAVRGLTTSSSSSAMEAVRGLTPSPSSSPSPLPLTEKVGEPRRGPVAMMRTKVTYEKATQTDPDLECNYPPSSVDGKRKDFKKEMELLQQKDGPAHVSSDGGGGGGIFRRKVAFLQKGCLLDHEGGRSGLADDNLSPLPRKGLAAGPPYRRASSMCTRTSATVPPPISPLVGGNNLLKESLCTSIGSGRGGGSQLVQTSMAWPKSESKHSRYASVGESLLNEEEDEEQRREDDGNDDNEEDEDRDFWLRPASNSEAIWLSSYFVDNGLRSDGLERPVTAIDCHPRNPQLIAAAYGSPQASPMIMKPAHAGSRRPLLGSATAWSTPLALWERAEIGMGEGGQAVVEDEGRVLVWSLQQREQPEGEFTCDSMVTALIWDPGSPWVVLAGTYSGQIVSWDMRVGQRPVQKSPLVFGRGGGHAHPVYVLEKVGDGGGSMFATASMDGRMCMWKRGMLGKVYEVIQLSQPQGGLYAFDIGITAAAFPSCETDSFYVGSEGGHAYQVLKLGSGAGADACIREEFGVGKVSEGMESRSQGKTGGETAFSGVVGLGGVGAASRKLWSPGLGRGSFSRFKTSRQRGIAHHAPVTAVHCHPSGFGPIAGAVSMDFGRGVAGGGRGAPVPGLSLCDLVLTSSVDWTCKLWYGKNTAQPLCIFEEASEYCFDVRWSPVNPSVFAVACGDGNVHVWNLNKSMDHPLVYANAVDSDAGSLRQGGLTGPSGLVNNRSALAGLNGVLGRGAKRAVSKVRWSLDGRKIITGDNAGVIYVYDMATEVACMEVDESERLQRKLKRMSTLNIFV